MIRAAEKVADASAVNIGTAEHIKIIDAANMIFAESGFTPKKLTFDTSKPVGVFSRAADLSLARERLGWEPQISFQDGLGRTINWYYSTRDVTEVASRLQVLLMQR